MTKVFETQVHWFHALADIKTVFTFLKKHIHKCEYSWTKDEKTAPSWSFILMLLMTINKFSEFGRICDDQGLDLVLESRVILYGMPSYSSVVSFVECPLTPLWYSHLALISYPFGYGGLLGLARMIEIPWFWTSIGSNSSQDIGSVWYTLVLFLFLL